MANPVADALAAVPVWFWPTVVAFGFMSYVVRLFKG